MSTSSTSQSASRSRGTQGTVNLREVRHAISGTRSTFTRVRTRRNDHPTAEQTGSQADFVTLVSLVCNIYQNSEHDLIPVQQFHPDAERHEDGGHTCIVSQRAISTSAASKYKRGATDSLAEDIVVKRTRQSVLEPQSSGLKSLINELSIRTHPPIRNHPNIVKFKGIAWDFEDDEATKPRPLLLEELAPQRSLEGFWTKYKFVRMTFQSNIELCLDIAQGLAALHACRIVHGDVKPENILVFPRIGHQDSFMAKLTDFGHSTSAHEKRTTLPAFTPQWCAPEVLVDDHHLEFSGMIATDVYSFGLVVLSIIVGRSYYLSIDDFTTLKQDGTMFGRAMLLVEQEDRQSHDSDFELDTIRSLLRATIRHDSARRSLPRCTRILKRYMLGCLACKFQCLRKTDNA
jgi:serine/threonine protein kinase